MHVNAKKMATGGLMLALTILCMYLGGIVESNTLFLLAAASYFVGIILREFGIRMGLAFYAAGVLLGVIIAPNKLYVLTYAAMGLYILVIDIVRDRLWERQKQQPMGETDEGQTGRKKTLVLFWLIKYALFNLMYLPMVLLLQEVLFAKALHAWMLAVVILGGQMGLFVYDMAYEYVQNKIWSKMRGKLFR